MLNVAAPMRMSVRISIDLRPNSVAVVSDDDCAQMDERRIRRCTWRNAARVPTRASKVGKNRRLNTQSGRGAVEKEVVPFDRGANQAGKSYQPDRAALLSSLW